jgi:hypothetical protein
MGRFKAKITSTEEVEASNTGEAVCLLTDKAPPGSTVEVFQGTDEWGDPFPLAITIHKE